MLMENDKNKGNEGLGCILVLAFIADIIAMVGMGEEAFSQWC